MNEVLVTSLCCPPQVAQVLERKKPTMLLTLVSNNNNIDKIRALPTMFTYTLPKGREGGSYYICTN